MFKKVALAFLAVVVLGFGTVFGIAASKPDEYHVQRSVTVNAPPDKIYAYVSDFKKWKTWSPFEEMDPEMERAYTGPESGKGSMYEWKGNDKVGQGRMEIVEATVPAKLAINLDMVKPFESQDKAEFTLQPAGSATTVTWAMTGHSPFLCKVMQVFSSMDTMIGGEFDRGLGKLKAISETK